ncbi:hypothetical protein D7V80_33405 [Corallococcus sp. CA054B]|uniref:hypothetical protein n=1 Tax=Corallococcus sp. CA054B TaxID=2316734 RepID=UPI000EA3922A|nr:hypothetical protein [Corallococcus sp. CA054B]RKG61718.1 hypothetical protein D7V80_33405 [Corallococcus sp. CA054B]
MSSFRALALLAALSLVPSSAGAEPETPVVGVPYVFATVDAYTVAAISLEITGTLVGENTPRTFRFWPGGRSTDATVSVEAARCDRLALLAMTRPGRYLFTWKWDTTAFNIVTCTLTRQ